MSKGFRIALSATELYTHQQEKTTSTWASQEDHLGQSVGHTAKEGRSRTSRPQDELDSINLVDENGSVHNRAKETTGQLTRTPTALSRTQETDTNRSSTRAKIHPPTDQQKNVESISPRFLFS